ncbi:MAG: TVP38/TMEM64 family protein [Gammaproteobacteria bacterium]|nr:TVP38/TMEM64 family protein [Gammaproteobacteria bacterium]
MLKPTNPQPTKPRVIFAGILLLLVFLFYLLTKADYHLLLENSELLKSKIESMGNWGPLVIIFSLATAIIMSPIPSAPIALVSGAIYGHAWGTLYVLIGSTLGATLAFLIARLLGYDILQRLFGGKLAKKWIGSQNSLMGIVFFSRLLPFVSFDFISYAAGLTSLTFWRFFIATVAGIAPASFLLAHFGDELSSADGKRIAFAILILSIITALPLIFGHLKKKYKRRITGNI